MGNIVDRQSDKGNEEHVGCVEVQSRSKDIHWTYIGHTLGVIRGLLTVTVSVGVRVLTVTDHPTSKVKLGDRDVGGGRHRHVLLIVVVVVIRRFVWREQKKSKTEGKKCHATTM